MNVPDGMVYRVFLFYYFNEKTGLFEVQKWSGFE